jgi:hypothetical protein
VGGGVTKTGHRGVTRAQPGRDVADDVGAAGTRPV